MTAEAYGLWKDLLADPVPPQPHPAPAVRGTVGNWLEDFAITTWPPAPADWRLTQLYAEGHGIHSSRGTPTRLIRSLVLAYFHRTSARGATAILHYKAGARKDGSGSWLFAEGLTWWICTDPDCERIQPHTAQLPKAAGADEIKALLSEGTVTCDTTPAPRRAPDACPPTYPESNENCTATGRTPS